MTENLQIATSHLGGIERHTSARIHAMMPVTARRNQIKAESLCGTTGSAAATQHLYHMVPSAARPLTLA
jgi:hypothetical protein